MHRTVFIVSEEPPVRDELATLVDSAGLDVETFPSLDSWLEAAAPERRGCLVLVPGKNSLTGPAEVATFAAVCARIPVLVLVDRGDVPSAVRAIKQGAADVLQKSLNSSLLLERIKGAIAGHAEVQAVS